MAAVLIVAGVVALVGGIIYLAWRAEKKRTEAMAQAATAMRFAFEETADYETLGTFPLFERGRARKAKNVMRGETAGHPVVVTDYSYTISSGKNSHTYSQTVVIFERAAERLPDFELGPENFLHRIGQVFGYQDIDFEGDEEFSKTFLLRGENEDGIRRVFTPAVLAACRNHPDWSVQVRGGRMAVFRAGKRCKPEEVPAQLAAALRAVTAFGSQP